MLTQPVFGPGAKCTYKATSATSSYDNAGRQVGALYQGGTRTTYTYDALGRRTLMQDASGATTYSYDALGRPMEVDYAYA